METNINEIREKFINLNLKLIKENIDINLLETKCLVQYPNRKHFNYFYISTTLLLLCILISIIPGSSVIDFMVKYALSTRCLIPNNYLIWEATRPISDCNFCQNITEALILSNLTKETFAKYAYSSQPIIVKGAVNHWPAMKKFSYNFFKNLYQSVDGAFENIDGCQFLHFQSDFSSIKDVFTMTEARAKNLPGEKPWYVGIGNCHSEILTRMRKYYSQLEFLPDDAEISNRDYIFFGYNKGANMHLDYIPRLMWQAQLKGSKTWIITPTPECETKCKKFIQFDVQAGDAVLLDTRIWYHSTDNKPGDFSLTLQSEYG